MSFANDLWDQSGNIAKHLDSELERMQSLSEFFKQMSQAEEIYSSALQKITKQERLLQPGSGNSVYVQMLSNLVKGVQKVSDSHQKLSDMMSKMSGTIATTIESTKVQNAKNFDSIASSAQSLVKSNDWVKLNKAFAVKELLQVEKLVSQKKDLTRQITMIKEVNGTLQKSIDSGNAIRRAHFQNLLPSTLSKIQADECFRLGVSKDTIRQICSYYIKALQNDTNVFTGIQNNASSVEPKDECQNLVNTLLLKVKPSIPGDFHFSDSIQEVLRKCEIRPQEEQQTVAKKAWADKFKGYEKEIKEIQSQIDCIEILLQNLSGTTTETEFVLSLDQQRTYLLRSMNKLLTGKYEVQLLISKDEGKPPPLPPKLNQIDEENASHSDAFSPLSAGGATLELKGSEFDDGGPSAHSSVLLLSPSVSKSDKAKSKSNIFGMRKESPTAEQKSLGQFMTETSRSKSRASAINKSSTSDSTSRSTKDLFEDLKEDELDAVKRSPTVSSKPAVPSLSTKPSAITRNPSEGQSSSQANPE